MLYFVAFFENLTSGRCKICFDGLDKDKQFLYAVFSIPLLSDVSLVVKNVSTKNAKAFLVAEKL
jgi:hypothetical protein